MPNPTNITPGGTKIQARALGIGTWQKLIGVLYDEGGTPLAWSAIAGTVMANASTFLALPFITPYNIQGPGVFFIGIIADGTGSTYGTIPANTHMGTLGGSSVATFTTPVALIISATPFTDAQAPIAHLY